jgi:methylenetetrahydrofolate dehydrogenase (NADP+)/methenyltetrahydrofolate cyclohydrolase
MKLLDGKIVADLVQKEIQKELSRELSGMQPRPPCLVALLTTDDPASLHYVKRKVHACHEVGITSRVIQCNPKETKELLELIDSLNEDVSVDGILIQLPLPLHVNLSQVLQRVDPRKDVDGFHPINVGKMFLGDPDAFYPCTPLGIKVLLEYYKIDVSTKHVVIVGRSNIVGKPLACMLMQNAPGCNATVTVAHRHTTNLQEICLAADVIVSAVGKPNLITADMVKPGAVVVDVGITKVADANTKSGFKLVGDVDYRAVSQKVSAITPVPGGVGPMTIAMLLKNTLKSFYLHR